MSCDRPAVALLTFSPNEAKAWLYDLTQPDSTGGIMLCRKHANATVVPLSWQLVDARDPAWPGPPLTDEELADAQLRSDEIDAPLVEVSAALVSVQNADETDHSDMAEVVALPLLSLGAPAAPAAVIRVDEHAMLPSDTAFDDEFAALGADLPITPKPYTPELVEVGVSRAPDPALFELPIVDVSNPHPRN